MKLHTHSMAHGLHAIADGRPAPAAVELQGRNRPGGVSLALTLTLTLTFTTALVLGGCAAPRRPAPVEDRMAVPVQPLPGAAPASAAAASVAPPAPLADALKPLPGAENAGKPGYYSVKPGDTLIRVALENGQNWKDLVRWNGLDNPNVIEVGQVLRVVAPGADATGVATRAVTTARIETRALDPRTGLPVAAPGPASPGGNMAPAATTPPVLTAALPAPSTSPAPAAAAPAPSPAPAPLPREGADDDIAWAWPAGGTVAGQFEEGRSKGLAIAGRAGDPVVAAADGKVVYAGSGLRGYGNLVILKHNNTYLTAYAHNQALLVKEDQSVRRGQKIAEMGSTDAERVQLHFEIRRLGKPVDPSRLLPAR